MGQRLLFMMVLLTPYGCKEATEPDRFEPVGIYSGPVTLDDTSVIVTDVDEAVLTVVFVDCEGVTCAEVMLDGTIETALGDIGDGTMPVEELVFDDRRVSGKLEYNGSLHSVKGTFSEDGLSLDAKISFIGHIILDLSADAAEAE
jgi:hypothetical protein